MMIAAATPEIIHFHTESLADFGPGVGMGLGFGAGWGWGFDAGVGSVTMVTSTSPLRSARKAPMF